MTGQDLAALAREVADMRHTLAWRVALDGLEAGEFAGVYRESLAQLNDKWPAVAGFLREAAERADGEVPC